MNMVMNFRIIRIYKFPHSECIVYNCKISDVAYTLLHHYRSYKRASHDHTLKLSAN